MKRIWSIQYLRGVAALAVVFFHTLESSTHKFGIGAAGVDIFFIISGFIMASLMLGDEARPDVFAFRRLVRIVPIYWLATTAAVAIAWIAPNFFHYMDASVENTLLSLAFIPHESQTGAAPVLWQGWTLEYEMFFYTLCTLALMFLPSSNRLKTLAGLLLLLSAIGLVLAPTHPVARAYTSPLLLEFAAGIGLATAWRAGLMPRAALGATSLIAGFAVFAALQIGVLPASGVRVIDWGIPAFLIVAGALCLEAGGRVAKSRFGLLLGDASYSLYLTHGFVVSAFLWFFADASLWIRAPVCAVGSVAVAIAAYLWFERPLMRSLRSVVRLRSVSP